MMPPVKLWIVCAAGGARADFVAGWLGTLPDFLNSNWNIDPATGVSIGNMGNLRSIDHNNTLPTTALNSYQLDLSNTAKVTWAVACHGHNLDPAIYQPYIDRGEIKFLSVELPGADKNRINWEFVVKTYLSKRRGIDWAQRNKNWVVDDQIESDFITDQDRINKTQEILKKQWPPKDRTIDAAIPATVLEYNKLFVPGGSRYLCNQLGIDVSDTHHNFWDVLLPFAKSPDSVEVWGVNWKKSDYFPD